MEFVNFPVSRTLIQPYRLSEAAEGRDYNIGSEHPHPTASSQQSWQDCVSFSLKGEGLAIFGIAQRMADFFQHAFDVFRGIIIPETNHGIAMCRNHFCSGLIGKALAMLATIQLHHQFRATTGEIRDRGADGKLPDELVVFQLRSTEARPESCFRFGHIAPQLASGAGQSLFRHISLFSAGRCANVTDIFGQWRSGLPKTLIQLRLGKLAARTLHSSPAEEKIGNANAKKN